MSTVTTAFNGTLQVNSLTATGNVNVLSLKYDVSNLATFTISAAGVLSFNTTGPNVSFSSANTVNILNTTDSTNTSTGAIINLGGMGVAKTTTVQHLYLATPVTMIKSLLDSLTYTDITATAISSYYAYAGVGSGGGSFNAQIPLTPDMVPGSNITVTIRWCTSTTAAGNEVWNLYQGIYYEGNTFTSAVNTQTASAPGVALQTVKTSFTSLTVTAPGDYTPVLCCKLTHDPASTYPDTWYLIAWDVEYTVDRLGY